MRSRMHVGAGRTIAGQQRRGAVVVLVMISLVVIFGCAAMAVDLTMLYSAQAELQRTADAAALAAAMELSGGDSSVEDEVFASADELAALNGVLRKEHGLDSMSDVEFGTNNYNSATGRSSFEPRSGPPYDAVRVTVRRAKDSGGGSVALFFSRLFGREEQDLEARAAATIVPRDIALSVDLSGSMAWDSSLRFWNRDDGGCANTRDVWCAMNGPEPHKPYEATTETASEYASDSGPTFGMMTSWGSHLTPGSYSPASDAGLFYIKKGTNTTSSAITTSLTARHYSADERSILMSASKDSSDSNHWKRRAAIMLGLASWKSGRSGGTPGGNGNTTIDSSEVTYIAIPSWAHNWAWTDYIDYMQGSLSEDAATFKYYYGLKTFTDFVLTSHLTHADASILWATPELPQRAVKDAVQAMMDELKAQDGMDKVSLEVFATTSRHEINLTDNFDSVSGTLYQRQAGHYDTTTNLGAALGQAITELTSSRARANSMKMILLLSDGLPNVDASGNNVGDGAASAVTYTRNKAQLAAQKGITVHTVSVGSAADRTLMKEIANIGGGVEFFAGGTPEEYSDALQNIFRRLGGKRSVRLIE
jgi:hypothetical protein